MDTEGKCLVERISSWRVSQRGHGPSLVYRHLTILRVTFTPTWGEISSGNTRRMKRTRNGNKFPGFCNNCSHPLPLKAKIPTQHFDRWLPWSPPLNCFLIFLTLITMAPPFMSHGRDCPSLFTAFTRNRYLGEWLLVIIVVTITIIFFQLDHILSVLSSMLLNRHRCPPITGVEFV